MSANVCCLFFLLVSWGLVSSSALWFFFNCEFHFCGILDLGIGRSVIQVIPSVRVWFVSRLKTWAHIKTINGGFSNHRKSVNLAASLHKGSVQSLSRVQLFATPWIETRQASLYITNSRSSLRFTFVKSVMPSSHLILWRPLLLLPSVFPSIRAFSDESALLQMFCMSQ